MNVIKVNNENFQEEVLGSEKPALVDFYTDWCGPCKMMAPIMDELAGQYIGQVGIYKLDVSTNTDIASQFGISSIPAFLFFKDGQVVDNIVGAVPKEVVEEKIQSFLKQD
ncbi:MAG: thioredoxin [Candidatus Omnitrophica bacterium]|nr:thioredoxin [Candidatus Omnitrophota bacterium]